MPQKDLISYCMVYDTYRTTSIAIKSKKNNSTYSPGIYVLSGNQIWDDFSIENNFLVCFKNVWRQFVTQCVISLWTNSLFAQFIHLKSAHKNVRVSLLWCFDREIHWCVMLVVDESWDLFPQTRTDLVAECLHFF